jgi:hypothetical protein
MLEMQYPRSTNIVVGTKDHAALELEDATAKPLSLMEKCSIAPSATIIEI